MKLTALAVTTLVGVATLAPLSAHAASPRIDDRATISIVGGSTVQRDSDNPGVVHLVDQWNPMACTASLIGRRWVLTARHCVDGENTVGIRSGSITSGRGTYSAVKNIYNAPEGDTALIELDTDASGPILRYATNRVPLNQRVRGYGWGATGNVGGSSKTLKTAEMKTIEYSPNSFYYGGQDVVVQGIDGVAYFGDSGGPLIYRGIVVGTVSGGSHNGDDVNAYENYALTSPVASWIARTSGISGTTV